MSHAPHSRSAEVEDGLTKEMTLEEYLFNTLPKSHLACREYEALKADRNRLVDELSFADLRASGGLPEAQLEQQQGWRPIDNDTSKNVWYEVTDGESIVTARLEDVDYSELSECALYAWCGRVGIVLEDFNPTHYRDLQTLPAAPQPQEGSK